jgi:hypothetical protein
MLEGSPFEAPPKRGHDPPYVRRFFSRLPAFVNVMIVPMLAGA